MTDTYLVERSTHISAPPSRIYPLLADFHQWPHWSPWEGLDPDMSRTYAGANQGVGAIYSWSGNRKAGKGHMEVTDAVDGERVEIALEFLKPFKSSSTTTFRLSQSDDGTTNVEWTMIGPKTFMTKVMSIFRSMDAMIGPDFEKGLAQLKDVVEA